MRSRNWMALSAATYALASAACGQGHDAGPLSSTDEGSESGVSGDGEGVTGDGSGSSSSGGEDAGRSGGDDGAAGPSGDGDSGGSSSDAGKGEGPLPDGLMAFPAPNSVGVCPDPPLRITFPGPPMLGTSGKIQVFASTGTRSPRWTWRAATFTRHHRRHDLQHGSPRVRRWERRRLLSQNARSRVRAYLLRERRLRAPSSDRRERRSRSPTGRHGDSARPPRRRRTLSSLAVALNGTGSVLLRARRDRRATRGQHERRDHRDRRRAPTTRSSTSRRRTTSLSWERIARRRSSREPTTIR